MSCGTRTRPEASPIITKYYRARAADVLYMVRWRFEIVATARNHATTLLKLTLL